MIQDRITVHAQRSKEGFCRNLFLLSSSKAGKAGLAESSRQLESSVLKTVR
jgi:hypothetical protein